MDQVTPNWWFGWLVWGFDPLVLVERRWETPPFRHQATNPKSPIGEKRNMFRHNDEPTNTTRTRVQPPEPFATLSGKRYITAEQAKKAVPHGGLFSNASKATQRSLQSTSKQALRARCARWPGRRTTPCWSPRGRMGRSTSTTRLGGKENGKIRAGRFRGAKAGVGRAFSELPSHRRRFLVSLAVWLKVDGFPWFGWVFMPHLQGSAIYSKRSPTNANFLPLTSV